MATDLEKRVIKQMEYYFGDCNLPRDRFLQEQIKLDDGWVTLETLLKFNRLKEICDDEKAIAEAIRKSTTGLLEVNEDGNKVRRNPEKAIPENNEDRRKELSARTVYAKEFPLDTTLDEVQEFFETFGEIDTVIMRKNANKSFKGSVFVTFKSEDSVKKFLEPESLKFKDKELEKRLKKDDYHQQKIEERKQVRDDKQSKKDQASERQKNDGDKKIENEMVKGALLYFDKIVEGTAREEIRNKLQDYAPIAWIDYNKGDTNAVVRYDQENQATEVLEKLLADNNNEIKFNEGVVESRVLEGEEEIARWKKMKQDASDRRNKKYNTKNFKKGKWGKRPSKNTRDAMKYVAKVENDAKRAALEGSDGPPEKKAKVEVDG